MDVAVTGASGFVGTALVRRLHLAGHTTHALSRRRLSDGEHATDYGDFPDADALVHLAEIADRHAAESAGPRYEATAARTLAALLSRRFDYVLYASTAVLYGDRHGAPCGVDTPAVASDRYTRIKLSAEQAVLARGGGVARLANLYGPGMTSGTVLGTILGQIPGNGPLRVNDDTPVRDFLWIDDAAAALVALLEHRAPGLFNVGSGVGTSVRELAAIALAGAGESDRAIEATARRDVPSSLVLDISHTCAALTWQPATSLPEGIGQLLRP